EAALRRGPAAPRAHAGPGADGAGARRPECPTATETPSTIWGPARAADPDGVGVAEPGWGRARGPERAGRRRPLRPAPPRPVQSTACGKGSARQSSTTAPESSQAAPALPRMPIALPRPFAGMFGSATIWLPPRIEPLPEVSISSPPAYAAPAPNMRTPAEATVTAPAAIIFFSM